MLRWVEGLSPKLMSSADIATISRLFNAETGEEYSETSIRSLPVPNWKGNLILLDAENQIKGVLWTTTLAKTTCRIVAFVISSAHQNQGLGSEGWRLAIANARNCGLTSVQLEVKASNSKAIQFYRKRGLEIKNNLDGYYANDLGHMMRGQISY